jgi:hypothetical protein
MGSTATIGVPTVGIAGVVGRRPIVGVTDVICCSASSTAAADAYRSFGSRAMHLPITSASASGMPLRSGRGSGGGPNRRAVATASGSPPGNARFPVVISYRMVPSA